MPQSAAEGGWWGTVLGTITSRPSLEWRVGLRGKPRQWCPKCNSSLAVQLVRAGGHKEEGGGRLGDIGQT